MLHWQPCPSLQPALGSGSCTRPSAHTDDLAYTHRISFPLANPTSRSPADPASTPANSRTMATSFIAAHKTSVCACTTRPTHTPGNTTKPSTFTTAPGLSPML